MGQSDRKGEDKPMKMKVEEKEEGEGKIRLPQTLFVCLFVSLSVCLLNPHTTLALRGF